MLATTYEDKQADTVRQTREFDSIPPVSQKGKDFPHPEIKRADRYTHTHTHTSNDVQKLNPCVQLARVQHDTDPRLCQIPVPHEPRRCHLLSSASYSQNLGLAFSSQPWKRLWK